MWAYHGRPSEEDVRTEARLHQLIPHPGLCFSLSRFWSLYAHLRIHPPKDAKKLRDSICVDSAGSIPFFTSEIAQRVVQLWPIVHSPRRYAKYVKERIERAKTRKGGADEEVPKSDTETLDKFADYAVATVSDKVLPQPGTGVVGRLRSSIETILALPTKIIPWLENNPYIGGSGWRDAIDLFLDVAPRFILAEEFIVTAIATPLIPLFGIGLVIEAIAFVVAEVLAMLTFLLALSVGKKGAAFLNFLQLIPFIGPLIRMGAVNTAQIYDKLAQKKELLTKVPIVGRIADRVLPETANAETSYTETPPAIQDESGRTGAGYAGHGRTRKQTAGMDRPRRRSKATRRASA